MVKEPLKDVTMERVRVKNLKSYYVKIMDESILFFTRVSIGLNFINHLVDFILC